MKKHNKKSKARHPLAVHFSSKRGDWTTPRPFFDYLNAEFHFTLDPCSSHRNCLCPIHYTKTEDGLRQDWADHVAYVNPPYGRGIGRWMRKAYESARAGATVVCLVPARTDTLWWHQYAMKGEVRLLKGRLKFGKAKFAAPFPSALIIYRPASFSITSTDAKAIQRTPQSPTTASEFKALKN